MTIGTLVIAAACLAITPGCANKFYTARLDPNLEVVGTTWTDEKQQIDGVIFYLPKLKQVIYEFTALEDAAGNVIATADGTGKRRCLKQQHVEFKTLPDYSQPYALRNKPSQFASGSLQVQLTDGMITSVNTASDPQLDETITAVATLAKEAASFAALGLAKQQRDDPSDFPLCKAAPVFVSIDDVVWRAATSNAAME